MYQSSHGLKATCLDKKNLLKKVLIFLIIKVVKIKNKIIAAYVTATSATSATAASVTAASVTAASITAPSESQYLEIFHALLKQGAQFSQSDYVPGRVVLINVSLAAGGAERQVINTMIGLKKMQLIEDLSLICENLFAFPNSDFYLPNLQKNKIKVNLLPLHFKNLKEAKSSLPPNLAALFARLPKQFSFEILNLVSEFKARRPEVAHLWQDSTSIRYGIAAVIAGVPKIILSSRNLPPFNFAYYQTYMRPGYLALSEFSQILFINNSEAGVNEYCKWLGLPRDRFKVLRNGVDLNYLMRKDEEENHVYKQALNIPKDAYVIGSIFRFYPEKRPLLWLKVALGVLDQNPNCYFIIVGDGPLREEMLKYINDSKFKDRFHFLGVQSDISPVLSIMDVFLLTSKFEGTPNVVLEAGWLGVPVVALEAGGTAEAIWEGETGYMAKNNDPDSIATLILRVLENPLWRKAIIQKGPSFIRKKFGIERMINETLALYRLKKSDAINGEIESTPPSQELTLVSME